MVPEELEWLGLVAQNSQKQGLRIFRYCKSRIFRTRSIFVSWALRPFVRMKFSYSRWPQRILWLAWCLSHPLLFSYGSRHVRNIRKKLFFFFLKTWQLYWQYTMVEHTTKREQTTLWTRRWNEKYVDPLQRQKDKMHTKYSWFTLITVHTLEHLLKTVQNLNHVQSQHMMRYLWCVALPVRLELNHIQSCV